jgi:hypothetical protein
MKCIKSIRGTKENDLGDIIRVDDKTANNMVGTYWKYVSKKEWKEFKNSVVPEEQNTVSEVEEEKKPKRTKKDKKKK